jgi:uncharacterized membrane protein (TIGR02234 family)
VTDPGAPEAGAARAAKARRSRLIVVAGLGIGAGVSLMAATQVWLEGSLDLIGLPPVEVSVTGRQAAPVLPAVALLALGAAVGLLLIGGPARRIFGAIVAVAALGAAWLTAVTIADPVAAVSGPLAQAAGLASPPADAALDAARSGWPVIGIAGLVIIAASGLGAAVIGRWPEVGRRYAAAPAVDPQGAVADGPQRRAEQDGIRLWDALERGDDPTL